MSDLLKRLKSKTTIKIADTIADSAVFDSNQYVMTPIPALNIALGGKVDAGLHSGVTILAAPSAHFKTLIGMMMVRSYMKQHEDAICLFYDSEAGISKEMFESFDIDPNRVLHLPITNIEELKFDIVQQLEELKRGDKVIIFIDSVGGLPSKKESTDALDGKSVADMTRAKEMKSLFRLITPHLNFKDIPCVAISQVYQTLEIYSKTVLSGGTGMMYAANSVIFITKSQEKEGDEVVGYNFKLIAAKSRFMKEKSVIPLTVTFEGGIKKWSGMFDIACELGWIQSPSKGWYQLCDKTTGELGENKYRAKDLRDNGEVFLSLLGKGMAKDIEDTYKLAKASIYTDTDEIVYTAN